MTSLQQQEQDQKQHQQQQLIVPHSSTQKEDESGGDTAVAVLLDSLPYIDQIHADYEAYALTLIEEEMMQQQQKHQQQQQQQQEAHPPATFTTDSSPHNHHLHLPPLFKFSYSQDNVKIIQEEYQQLMDRNGQKRSDQEDQPQFHHHILEDDEGGSTPPMVAKQDSNKIRTAKIILLHEQIRQIHLELYAISASSMWKHHVSMMDKYALYSKEMLEQQLLKVDEINAERKRMQEEAVKSQLGRLEYRWGELMSKKQHLMRGVKILEEEMMKE